MSNGIATNGIMFTTDSGDFPTVADVDWETSYYSSVDGSMLDLLRSWKVIAYDPYERQYGNETTRVMDETNWDALINNLTNIPATSYDTLASFWADRTTTFVDDAEYIGSARFSLLSLRLERISCARLGGTLIVSPDNSVDLATMGEMADHLIEYSLLDEDAYSERENEAWQEYASTALGDELRTADYPDEIKDWLVDHDADVLSILTEHLDYYDGFSGEYSPSFVSIIESLGGPDAVKTEVNRLHS